MLGVWSSFYGLHCCLPSQSSSPELYANQTDDNLQRTFVKAIGDAHHSITLYIYSLTDEKILDALLQKEQEGIAVKVFYDPSTKSSAIAKLANATEIKARGLMHKKILVVDEETVWIGSANFTSASLKLHDNLVVGSVSPELAATILANKQHHHFTLGGQLAEFWSFPESAEEGLERLITLINEAITSIFVGMFTWTHPQVTDAILAAASRGVNVQVALDRGQSKGTNKKEVLRMINSPVEVRLNRGSELFHHKFVIIDNTTLINGSANWTKSAFGRNHDCFIILHNLEEKQLRKLERLWHVIRSTTFLTNEKNFMVFGQRPNCIIYKQFECIDMVA